jgi:hypothetical protein
MKLHSCLVKIRERNCCIFEHFRFHWQTQSFLRPSKLKMTKTFQLWTLYFSFWMSLASVTQVLSTEITPSCSFLLRWNELLGMNLYKCKLKAKDIRGQNVTVKTISGKHCPRKTNQNVLFLVLDDFKCDEIPSNFGKVFLNLLGIRAIKNGLKTIEAENLKHFKHLKHLKIQDNHIKFLKNDVFKFNKELEYVEFIKTDLVFVDSRSFDHTKNLKLVDFRDNSELNSSIAKIHNSSSELSKL